jgi:hypothetical protein
MADSGPSDADVSGSEDGEVSIRVETPTTGPKRARKPVISYTCADEKTALVCTAARAELWTRVHSVYFAGITIPVKNIVRGNQSEIKQQEALVLWEAHLAHHNLNPADPENPDEWGEVLNDFAYNALSKAHNQASANFAYQWITGRTSSDSSKKAIITWMVAQKIHPFSHLTLRSLALYQAELLRQGENPLLPEPVLIAYVAGIPDDDEESESVQQNPDSSARPQAPETLAPTAARSNNQRLPTPVAANASSRKPKPATQQVSSICIYPCITAHETIYALCCKYTVYYFDQYYMS